MPASSYRTRRCPSCNATFAAGELGIAGRYRAGYTVGFNMRRSCPNCGHVAITRAFTVVRDTRIERQALDK